MVEVDKSYASSLKAKTPSVYYNYNNERSSQKDHECITISRNDKLLPYLDQLKEAVKETVVTNNFIYTFLDLGYKFKDIHHIYFSDSARKLL